VDVVQPNWAEENLQVIRTLMERAGLYRRALAPVMLSVGVIGLVAGVIGTWINISWIWGVGQYWVTVAIISLATTALLVRRQALKVREPFWTMPARKVCLALAPPFVLGGLVGAFDIHRGYWGSSLVEIWLGLYGCGLCAAGMYLTRGVSLLGWLFIVSALMVAAVQHEWGIIGVSPLGGWTFYGGGARHVELDPSLVMGATFGGFHLVAGIYLYFTEKREPTP
jgi:hypothetical protein